MTSGTANSATAPTMASPAEALASTTMAGAYSAARASGPPNDVTARPVKAHPLTGRPDSSGGRSAPVALIRARKVVTAALSPSWYRSWRLEPARRGGRG